MLSLLLHSKIFAGFIIFLHCLISFSSASVARWSNFQTEEVFKTTDFTGVYGVSLSHDNYPGSRSSASMVSDSNTKAYLFGGTGYPETGFEGLLGDLWELDFSDPTNYQWRFFDVADGATRGRDFQSTSYSTSYDDENYPSGRDCSTMFMYNNSIFIVGGFGYQQLSTSSGKLGDMWQFSLEREQWRFVIFSKNNSLNVTMADFAGVYGENFSQDFYPGARSRSHHVLVDDRLFLFGGDGNDVSGDYGRLGDLWEFDIKNSQWRFINTAGGETQKHVNIKANIDESIGPLYPGSRGRAASFYFNNKIYIFGGEGYGINNETRSNLCDLWSYSLDDELWTFHNTANEDETEIPTQLLTNMPGKYGTSFFNGFYPGSRLAPNVFVYSNFLMLFGGFGVDDILREGELGDLWQLDLTNHEWRLIDTLDSTPYATEGLEFYGVYSDSGEGYPGAREGHSFLQINGKGVLAFGKGFTDTGKSGRLGDFWVLDFCTGNFEISSDCSECIDMYSLDSSCSGCKENVDASSGCTVCINQYNISTDCTTCNGKFNISTECIECNSPYVKNENNSFCEITISGVNPTKIILIVLPIVFISAIIISLVIVFGVALIVLLGKKTQERKTKIKEMEKRDTAKIDIDESQFEIKKKEIKILNMIGKGAGGSVFKAKWNGDVVAYKVFQIIQQESYKGIFDDFEREVKIMASISHKNVLRFYGAVLEKPSIGIVMEFCSKGDVETFYKKLKKENKNDRELRIDNRIQLLRGISSGMHYLHNKEIIHRDLKPQNVLIDELNVPKIIDFGLSKKLSNQSQENLTKFVGTSYYMAPEVTLGKTYDKKIDIFAFAIMMHCIFFLNFYPYGDSRKINYSLENKVANDPSHRPKIDEDFVEKSKIPVNLVSLMQNCWNHEPSLRPTFKKIKKEFDLTISGNSAINKIESQKEDPNMFVLEKV